MPPEENLHDGCLNDLAKTTGTEKSRRERERERRGKRFDIDVRVEGVLIEENRAAFKVRHVKPFLKNIVINIVRRFLQGNKYASSP